MRYTISDMAVFGMNARKSPHSGERTVFHPYFCLFVVRGLSITVDRNFCVANCESCTQPIYLNPASREASELGLTHETCFVACDLELAAVAVLLWFWLCALRAAVY